MAHESRMPLRHASLNLRPKPILWFVAGFIAVAIVLHVALWLVLGYFARPTMATGIGTTDSARLAAPIQPDPEHPELPWQDLQALRARENQWLGSYGPAESGFAHVPIERAMDLFLAQRASSAASTAPATQEGGR